MPSLRRISSPGYSATRPRGAFRRLTAGSLSCRSPRRATRECSASPHAVVFADVDREWVTARLAPGDLGAPLGPPFLQALSAATNRRPGSIDMLCVAGPLPGPPPIELTPDCDPAHPRVGRALNYRDDVRAWQADGGVVVLGRGVAGRWETAIEVDEDQRERGLGRSLARAARHLIPEGERLWAQVAPANAASVRAFIAAGFVPVGAEILLARRPA
jgi:FR47-like protein